MAAILERNNPENEPSFVYPTTGWQMDQQSHPAQVVPPYWPLLYGVDGRCMGALRRFRGFRRLDYDIREYSNGSYVSHHEYGIAGGAFSTNFIEGIFPRYGPHDWDGYPQTPGIDPDINPPDQTWHPNTDPPTSIPKREKDVLGGSMQVYDFFGVTIGQPAGRPPMVGFVISSRYIDHQEDSKPRITPMVKFLGRQLGETLDELGGIHASCFQVLLQYLVDTSIPGFGYPALDAYLPTSVKYPSHGAVVAAAAAFVPERIGAAALGRSLLVSHRNADPTYYLKGGKTHVYTPPVDLLLPLIYDMPDSLRVHANGKHFLVAKAAGSYVNSAEDARAALWFGEAGWKVPNQIDYAGHGSIAGTNYARHTPGSRFKCRIRFVNKTTGFVGPISDPMELGLMDVPAPPRELIKWAEGPLYLNVNGNDRGLSLLRALIGGDRDKVIVGRDLHSIWVQIFCTLSTPPDDPAWGQGTYFLDQEIPIEISNQAVPGGWRVLTHQSNQYQGVPALSNAELVQQEPFDPEFDIAGPLEPGPALGEVDGALLSLAEGGSTDESGRGATRDDIRVSPPWKFDPNGWIETTHPQLYHRVIPKSQRAPGFLKAGSLAYFISSNRMVRIRRDGTDVYVKDAGDKGPTNREAAVATEDTLFMVTDADIIEIAVGTGAWAAASALHNLITVKWREAVRDGNMMVGYDPQLQAVFVCPRRNLTSPVWRRSECAVLWLTTGRITMLHDVYWVGMAQGTHPVTGKQHLFFIDPAHNITYPDDYVADDDDQVASMTGVSRFSYPDRARVRPTLTITISDRNALAATRTAAADGKIHVAIDGIDFVSDATVPAPGDGRYWDIGGDEATTASSLHDAIRTYTALFSGHPRGIYDVSVLGNVITVTGYWGIAGQRIPVACLPNPIPGLLFNTADGAADGLHNFTAGEITASHAGETWGGVVRGAITALSTVSGVTTVTDTFCSLIGKGTFDRYSWYNPYAETEAATHVYQPALRGSQVYFFRLLTDDDGVPRTHVIADARIDDNTLNTFAFNVSELNLRSGISGLALDDQYAIAPVVFQVVGAPIEVGGVPGLQQVQRVAVNTLGFAVEDRKGFAADGATQYPAVGSLQGDMFVGVTTPRALEGMALGSPLVPTVERSLPISADNRENVAYAGTGGYNQMPVVTNYGTHSNFDLTLVYGRASQDGENLTGVV